MLINDIFELDNTCLEEDIVGGIFLQLGIDCSLRVDHIVSQDVIAGEIASPGLNLAPHQPLAGIPFHPRCLAPEVLGHVVAFERPVGTYQGDITLLDVLAVFFQLRRGHRSVLAKVREVDDGRFTHKPVQRHFFDGKSIRQVMDRSIYLREAMHHKVHIPAQEVMPVAGRYRC